MQIIQERKRKHAEKYLFRKYKVKLRKKITSKNQYLLEIKGNDMDLERATLPHLMHLGLLRPRRFLEVLMLELLITIEVVAVDVVFTAPELA